MALAVLFIPSSVIWLAGCSGISQPAHRKGNDLIRAGEFLEVPGKTLYVHRRNGPRLRNVTVYEWDQGRMARRYHCDFATLVSESAADGMIIHMQHGMSYETVPGDVRMCEFDSRRIVLLMPGHLQNGCGKVQPVREARPE